MPLEFSELVRARARGEWLKSYLDALQGRGFVMRDGVGTGSLAITGTPAADSDVVVKITTAGGLGVARFAVSLDGGANFGVDAAVPSTGEAALGTTGVLLAFEDGSTADGNVSFAVGDTFTFELRTPTFPVTAWQPGSTPLTLLELKAGADADRDLLIAEIGRSGFMRYARGAWATLGAKEIYNLDRTPGTLAKHRVVLTDAKSSGPHTITPGAFWVVSDGGRRFVAETGGTLPKGLTLAITVTAESPGAEYNEPIGTIRTLVTVLPGVTCTNPDAGDGDSIQQQGSNQESEAALYLRCQQRWPSLSAAPTEDVFELWAKAASAEVKRSVAYPSATVPGQVDVYLAGDSGAVSAQAVADAAAYIGKRVSITNTANVQAAANVAINVTATVYVRTASRAAAEAAAAGALAAYLRTVPLGGKVRDVGGIAEALTALEGVSDVDLVLPAGDVQLLPNQTAITGTILLTWIQE